MYKLSKLFRHKFTNYLSNISPKFKSIYKYSPVHKKISYKYSPVHKKISYKYSPVHKKNRELFFFSSLAKLAGGLGPCRPPGDI